jgi:Na+/proline symporter
VAIAVPAVGLASRGLSVLYLFLMADLVCSAAVFPLFFGLYARRFNGAGALVSMLAGLVAGALFFPRPDFTPWFNPAWLHLHHDFQFLASFGSALLVSTLVAVAWNLVAACLGDRAVYDFGRLAGDVTLIEG